MEALTQLQHGLTSLHRLFDCVRETLPKCCVIRGGIVLRMLCFGFGVWRSGCRVQRKRVHENLPIKFLTPDRIILKNKSRNTDPIWQGSCYKDTYKRTPSLQKQP